MDKIRVVDVNRQTLAMFEAPDRQTLIDNVDSIFRDDMHRHFGEQLVKLFNGELEHERESVNYTLAGNRLNVYLQFSVLPGHESDWKLVLISLMDITARKKAEAYLEFLGTHDPLSKLRNRTFFNEEMKRLDRRGPWPVTVLVIDLNHLKAANDEHGHATGDALIRRAGEVLSKSLDGNGCAARIGGDEFALLLPATDQAAGQKVMEKIDELVTVNNRFYSSGPVLSFALGMATGHQGVPLEDLVRRADGRMYDDKREYYERRDLDRRQN
jgi:diguanylate cyclase (GGDEF)-like protein